MIDLRTNSVWRRVFALGIAKDGRYFLSPDLCPIGSCVMFRMLEQAQSPAHCPQTQNLHPDMSKSADSLRRFLAAESVRTEEFWCWTDRHIEHKKPIVRCGKCGLYISFRTNNVIIVHQNNQRIEKEYIFHLNQLIQLWSFWAHGRQGAAWGELAL